IGDASAGNVVSGVATGILAEGDSQRIQGNFIGTDVTGSMQIGNGKGGIDTSGSGAVIGGSAPAQRNIIAGNNGFGIRLNNATGALIQGNNIGTDISGAVNLANTGDGIEVDNGSNLAIGPGNVIAYNQAAGVSVRSPSAVRNSIENNSIFLNGG